jgi:hypothetical protein
VLHFVDVFFVDEDLGRVQGAYVGSQVGYGIGGLKAGGLCLDLLVHAHEAVLLLLLRFFFVFVVNTVVKLCVVVQHVLTVDFLALISKNQNILG